ncbi:hypothetical protein LTR36_009766 [Oleoguttula mirabilis]|uniref:Uncharacterized protein n=1 Tax=Oleoguttula mirabilis TaxID=1507867 RepID=A0AAV9J6T0_9PEZI|nr:hypothetical protein LTR36_009766 [Oleoguttula mirabilis]
MAQSSPLGVLGRLAPADRLRIYEYLFDSRDDPYIIFAADLPYLESIFANPPRVNVGYCPTVDCEAPLLSVSKIIRQEAVGRFYDLAVFGVDVDTPHDLKVLKKWLELIGEDDCRRISNVKAYFGLAGEGEHAAILINVGDRFGTHSSGFFNFTSSPLPKQGQVNMTARLAMRKKLKERLMGYVRRDSGGSLRTREWMVLFQIIYYST